MACLDCGGACDTLTVDQYLDALEAEMGVYDEAGTLVAGPQPPAPEPSHHVQLVCCAVGHKGDRIMEVGPPGAPVSHGLCANCLTVEMEAL